MTHGVSWAGIALGTLALVQVAAASGQTLPQPPPPPPAVVGFLSFAQLPDVIRIVPAAPASDDSRFVADMAVYRATRAHGPFAHVDVRGSRARWGRR